MLALLVAILPVVLPAPASAYPTSTVELSGHGYGHGRGMGQWGALGYALDHNWDHGRILDHFYGGTSPGSVSPEPAMTVRLTRFDGGDTLVFQERGQLRTNAAPGSFTGLRARLVRPNTFAVERSDGCGGPWSFVTEVTGPVRFFPAVAGSDDRTEMLQLCEPGGARRWVRGEVRAVDDGGAPRTVNVLGMESYLRGVVPQEVPASWGTLGGGLGMHALRAQSVAARSYAQTESRYPYAKTCDTTSCQVYGGVAVQTGAGFTAIEQANTDVAVRETAGQVRRFSNGSVARTEFSSSTGGWSAGGTFPPVHDAGDTRSPYHAWTASIRVADIETAYPQLGVLQSVDVTGRNGLGEFGGRVTSMVLRGSSGSVTLTGLQFRMRLGLRSDWFLVKPPPTHRLDAFVRGTDNRLYQRSWDGTRWLPYAALGGILTSDPASVSWGPGRIDVFARGTDNQLYHRAFAGGRWHDWRPLGGALTAGPAVASWGAGRLDVFVRGTDGRLFQRTFDGTRWLPYAPLDGVVDSDPAATSWGPGRIDVFARGTDGQLIHRAFAGGRWFDWQGLGGTLTSGPAAASS